MRTKRSVSMKYVNGKKLLRKLNQNYQNSGDKQEMPERIVGIPGYISSVTRMHGSKFMSH